MLIVALLLIYIYVKRHSALFIAQLGAVVFSQHTECRKLAEAYFSEQ